MFFYLIRCFCVTHYYGRRKYTHANKQFCTSVGYFVPKHFIDGYVHLLDVERHYKGRKYEYFFVVKVERDQVDRAHHVANNYINSYKLVSIRFHKSPGASCAPGWKRLGWIRLNKLQYINSYKLVSIRFHKFTITIFTPLCSPSRSLGRVYKIMIH